METYEVIKFVKLHFDTNWTCNLLPDAVMQYIAVEKEARLKVVAEGDAGLWSYDFTIKQKKAVFVIGEVVHIPNKYLNKTNGNSF